MLPDGMPNRDFLVDQPGQSFQTRSVPVKTGRLVNLSAYNVRKLLNIFRQISAKLLPETKAALLWRLSFRMGSLAKACFQPLVNRISNQNVEELFTLLYVDL